MMNKRFNVHVNNNRPSTVTCYKCGGKGHYADQCVSAVSTKYRSETHILTPSKSKGMFVTNDGQVIINGKKANLGL